MYNMENTIKNKRIEQITILGLHAKPLIKLTLEIVTWKSLFDMFV